MTPASRRNIWMEDDLWERVVKAALGEGVARGQPVSASEWVREAIEEKLEREGEK